MILSCFVCNKVNFLYLLKYNDAYLLKIFYQYCICIIRNKEYNLWYGRVEYGRSKNSIGICNSISLAL